MTPCVSILVPTYNREAFIGQCIESALDQKYTDFEIVVVDNASTDSTLSICNSYAERDSRIRVFLNDSNIGPVKNWERCIALARGKYGKLLFSDDMMMPDFLSETVQYFQSSEIAFVSTAAVIGETPETGKVSFGEGESVEVISSAEYFKRLSRGYPAAPVSPGAALFRLADLRRNLMLDIPTATPHDFAANGAGPDVLLFALTAREYPVVAQVKKPLVFFRKHEGSFTIVNEDNAVSEGYALALSWFFRTRTLSSDWATWVARIWLRTVLREKRLVGPGSVAKRYSGEKFLPDACRILIASCFVVFSKIWRSLVRCLVPSRLAG